MFILKDCDLGQYSNFNLARKLLYEVVAAK